MKTTVIPQINERRRLSGRNFRSRRTTKQANSGVREGNSQASPPKLLPRKLLVAAAADVVAVAGGGGVDEETTNHVVVVVEAKPTRVPVVVVGRRRRQRRSSTIGRSPALQVGPTERRDEREVVMLQRLRPKRCRLGRYVSVSRE